MSFSLSVRQHVMIAHSFNSEAFGPAQRLHGATYVASATFFASTLDENNLVIDIGIADELLKSALAPLAYRNLDEMPEFAGILTTTEYLCGWLHKAIAKGLGGTPVTELMVELRESHVAWASYRAPVEL